MAPWLISLESLADHLGAKDRQTVGLKASRLAWLARHRLPVPETWVLPRSAFTQALRTLPAHYDLRALLRAAGGGAGELRAAEARRELLNVGLPAGLHRELDDLWTAFGPRAPSGIAVRPSLIGQDHTSPAGFELSGSTLGVRSANALVDAVRVAWASLVAPRVLGALAAHGARDASMGVIFQATLDPLAVGRMTTRCRRGEHASDDLVIESRPRGTLKAVHVDDVDVYRLNDEGHTIETLLARNPKGSRSRTSLGDEHDSAHTLLTNADLNALFNIATRLEKSERGPWSVTFAKTEESIWILHASTAAESAKKPSHPTVWSRVQLGEFVSEVPSPLAASTVSALGETVLRQFADSLDYDVPKSVRFINASDGRLYLNATLWSRVVSHIPWRVQANLSTLRGDAAVGLDESPSPTTTRRRFGDRLPFVLTRFIREQREVDQQIARYEAKVALAERRHPSLDLVILPDEGLAYKIRELQSLLEATVSALLGATSNAVGAHLALTALLARVRPVGADRLARSLTVGLPNLESVRLVRGLFGIAHLARNEPDVCAGIVHQDLRSVQDFPEGSTRQALERYLATHGRRTVRETEPGTPTWREDLRPVITMLRVALRSEVDLEPARARTRADNELVALLPRLTFLERSVIRPLLQRARKSLQTRERIRAWVPRVLYMLHDTLRDADRRLLKRDPDLANDETSRAPSAFDFPLGPASYFSLDELFLILRSAPRSLSALVAARRAEHRRNQLHRAPPNTFDGASSPPPSPFVVSEKLRGISAGRGVVDGIARVIVDDMDFNNYVPGEILIATAIDVGWLPLAVTASGVATEFGGPLSTTVITLRECGIPCVVRVEGVLRHVRTGDRIRIDADRGLVNYEGPSSMAVSVSHA